MFSKSALGIQREHDDSLSVRLEGSRKEILVLLATLNAKVIKEMADEPKEYSTISTAIQENTLKAYMRMIESDLPENQGSINE